MSVDVVVSNGAGGYCSPCHRMNSTQRDSADGAVI
jgi:hypothetical protein